MAEAGMFVVPTPSILERSPGRAGGATLIADERRAATSAPADALRLDDRGRVRPGARPDLVLVESGPTADIMATRAIRAVWKGGERFDHEAYAARIEEARES